MSIPGQTQRSKRVRRRIAAGLIAVAASLVVQSTQASAATIELVSNGSFETGTFAGWTTTTLGTPFIDWTISGAGSGSGFLAPTQPQDGSFVAWNGFDGGGPMSFSLYQDVTIPTGSTATLSWMDRLQWDFFITSNATQPRTYAVDIVDPSTNLLLATVYSLSTGTAVIVGDTGWQAHSVDLTAYAGQTIRLLFREFVPEFFTGPGQAEFDAISILATTADVPEPASVLLLGAGILGAGLRYHRRRRHYPA